MMMMLQMYSIIIILELLLQSFIATNGAYLAITNSLPKCVVVHSPKGSMFSIEYERHNDSTQQDSPHDYASSEGMQKSKAQLMKDHDPTAILKEERRRSDMMMGGRGSAMQTGRQDGRDEMWQKRQMDTMQRNMDIMKRKTSISLAINEFDEMNSETKKSPSITNHSLSQTVGSIRHKMQAYHAAKICVSSYGATIQKPIFISLRIREVYEKLEVEDKQKSAQSAKDKEMVDNHMKYLERELYLMIQAANRMIDESTLAKQSHSRSYDNSAKLPRTLKWISIGQLLIILCTASFYSRCTIAYLRKHKILY